MLLISEIFGPVIQGEGVNIGLKVSFLRVAGCDYHCGFSKLNGKITPNNKLAFKCDTRYSWDTKFKNTWKQMTEEQILEKLESFKCKNLCISGGNPALQDLYYMIGLLHTKNYYVTMETQGSVYKPWFESLNHITISPKPPSSGMPCDMDIIDKIIKSNKNFEIKIVIGNIKTDLKLFNKFYDKYPNAKFVLQVCNDHINKDSPMKLLKKYKELSEIVLKDDSINGNVRVLPQAHVLMWGNQRGR